MTRREALRTLAAGAAAGALAGGVVTIASPSDQAAAGPLASADSDELVRALTLYRQQLEAHDSGALELPGDDFDDIANRSWGPFYYGVVEDPATLPPVTSLAGVSLVLRTVIREDDLGPFDAALIRAAFDYLEGVV